MSKQYTKEQHNTWSILFTRQLAKVKNKATKLFLEGLDTIAFDRIMIPSQDTIDSKLHKLTGWHLVDAENEYLGAKEWFDWLVQKRFPVTSYIRQPHELEFTPLPDMFHEYFGHLAFFTNQEIADLAHRFGVVAKEANQQQLLEIQRLWWFSFEFGFIREKGEQKVFGAGLLSSPGEFNHALSNLVTIKLFTIEEVIETPLVVAGFHQTYFLIESIAQLREFVERYAKQEGLLKDLNPIVTEHDREHTKW